MILLTIFLINFIGYVVQNFYTNRERARVMGDGD
jgi:hypothetical protein